VTAKEDRDPLGGRQPRKLSLSNEAFLRALFGADWERAHVTGFPQDPLSLNGLGLRHLWGGMGAKSGLGYCLPGSNTFFTISLFKPDPQDGRQRRRKALFERAVVVVLDDVDWRDAGVGTAGAGTAKVSSGKVAALPTWVLETSPGNCQVGYLLKGPETRGGKVNALLDALVASGLVSDGSDPGMKGVTRYVRLPVGRNTKAKYGAGGFEHRLLEWNPNVSYGLEQLAQAYGVRAAVDVAEDDLGASLWNGLNGSGLDAGDWVWQALQSAGSVLGVDAGKGLAHVICPWVSEHGGGDTSGTAYLGDGVWKCYHGHCEDRTPEEFTSKLRAEFPRECRDAVAGTFGAVEGDEGVAPSALDREAREMFGDAAVDAAVEKVETEKNPILRALKGMDWEALGAGGVAPPGPEFVVPGYVPRGLVTTLYGVDGVGKNMLIQRACMLAVARGEFFGQRVAPGFRAAVLGVEDLGDAIRDRAWRIGQEAAFGAGDWKALGARFVMPELIDVDAKMMAWDGKGEASVLGFARAVGKFVEVWKPDLLVLDPISDLFSDEENNRARVVEFMRMMVRLARRKNIGLVLIGHPARSEGSEYSGSGAWSSKSRSRMLLERDKDDADTIWLRAPKSSYGPRMDDRECRWSLNGVLVDMPGPGGAGVGGVGGGAGGGSQGRQDAIRQSICAGLEALARAGINTGLGNRAGNKTVKSLRDYGALRGLSDLEVQKEVKAMLGDGTLISGFVFNGAGGSPVMRSGHSDFKTGLYFPGGANPIVDPF
jgi:AAA domain